MSQEAKRTLIFAFLKFLRDELKDEKIAPDFKESLEVASQCLESSYEISVDDEICQTNFDANLDLLSLAEKSVIRKVLPPEEKEKADKFKTAGNDLMKQEKYSEALEQYNQAIQIDKNNAVYYCNRAAAHSKLADYTQSIEDCKIALKIDPSYGKAWGRLGLALLSNNQFEEAYEAYNKAIQLEPTNDGYKQNLKIVEEKLRTGSGAGGQTGAGFPGMPDMGNMMGMFNNPQFMNMATQLMADPQMQNVMSNLVTNMFGAEGGPGGPGTGPAAASPASDNSTTDPADTSASSTNAPPSGGFENILNSAQNWATQMNAMNPEFVQQLRERMNLNPEGGNASSSEASTQGVKEEKPDIKEEKKE